MVYQSWFQHLYYNNVFLFLDVTTCSEAGFSPGCCMSGCVVVLPDANCYCDFICIHFNDCCEDVLERIPFSCTDTGMIKLSTISNRRTISYYNTKPVCRDHAIILNCTGSL